MDDDGTSRARASLCALAPLDGIRARPRLAEPLRADRGQHSRRIAVHPLRGAEGRTSTRCRVATIARRASARPSVHANRSVDKDPASRTFTAKTTKKKSANGPGAVTFKTKSENEKLSPVLRIQAPGRNRRLLAQKPFACSTYFSIAATCPGGCPFKGSGCYADASFARSTGTNRDEAVQSLTADEVIAEEVRRIDGSFRGGPIPQDGAKGGRDLRLHAGGDVSGEAGARMLAGAAECWLRPCCGSVWTFTHRWREVPREAWGSISVIASVEPAEDIVVARAAEYPAAIVVDVFPSDKAFSIPRSGAKIVPCPTETRGTTCVECRLCLDVDLLERNVAVAVEAHGPTAPLARDALVQLCVPEQPAVNSKPRRAT